MWKTLSRSMNGIARLRQPAKTPPDVHMKDAFDAFHPCIFHSVHHQLRAKQDVLPTQKMFKRMIGEDGLLEAEGGGSHISKRACISKRDSAEVEDLQKRPDASSDVLGVYPFTLTAQSVVNRPEMYISVYHVAYSHDVGQSYALSLTQLFTMKIVGSCNGSTSVSLDTNKPPMSVYFKGMMFCLSGQYLRTRRPLAWCSNHRT